MKQFQQFPWSYIQRILESREPFFDRSMRVVIDELGSGANACPECGKKPAQLTWIPVQTADDSWIRNVGQSGFLTCCMECKTQIDFFVDDELTHIEAELRAAGKSTEDVHWCEASSEILDR